MVAARSIGSAAALAAPSFGTVSMIPQRYSAEGPEQDRHCTVESEGA
jgi:hypothetical protein